MQAYIAEELAAFLLDTYHSKHLPQMVADFKVAGFTKENLSLNPHKVYLMIVVASFDRRPFTGAAGGYEYIWGMKGKSNSLPARLSIMGLSDPNRVSAASREKIRSVLAEEKIAGHLLARYENVDYSKTIYDAAAASENLFRMLLAANSAKDSLQIYSKLIEIHGIGETIASKLLKYLLREIAIGNIPPGNSPLSVTWPIVNEYHNEQAVIKLRKLGADIAPLAMGLLLQKEDPFAIDALFYLNRYDQRLLDEFIADMSQWKTYETKTSASFIPKEKTLANVEKAKLLLAVIEDVCTDIRGVTKEELQGLVQPRQLEAAANKLYANMAGYASKGDINNMHRYYENCLNSGASRWDFILEKIGKKSLQTEWERFRKIFES